MPSGSNDGGALEGGLGEGESGAGPSGDPRSVLLLTPREGVPPVVETAAALAATVDALGRGTGPVAVDAERASGYRYGQRAYLVQLRRSGAGTALIDPIACPDLSALGDAITDAEWVLHAASQDLPCLAGIGLRPGRLFDTELAGRLAGFERVGLGAMVERVLGIRLEKGHSAADWSRRPLPEPWLRYAALDVEVLVDLRDALEEELRRQDKLAWAHEEFAALAVAPLPLPRREPWRRTSGIHRVRNRRQLAALRALWEVRDALAAKRDVAPGRLLPDAALVAAATSGPATLEALRAISGFGGRAVRGNAEPFLAALAAATALPDDELPSSTPSYDGPPPAARWADRDPVAAERLTAARATVTAIADGHRLPVENLLSPDLVRRLAWTPPEPLTAAAVAEVMTAAGARSWQVGLTADPLTDALAAAPEGPAEPLAEPPG
ncbi:MAG: ribonuclease D [Frankiaceae bacterium]